MKYSRQAENNAVWGDKKYPKKNIIQGNEKWTSWNMKK